MSFYDDASLVVIPSAQKTSKLYAVKPTDGSGDLTFTRTGDTSTRVNSAGLIEKVRTNLILQSEALDNAAWTKSGVGTFTSAITTGFTDPTGGTDAQRWLATIASVSDRAFVRQLATLTNGIPYVISFWVKSNTGSSQDIYFLFQGGAVQATTATTSWQRISYSATTSTTSVLVGIEAKDLAIDVLVYGFQLEVGNVMTDNIPTTTAAVSVGPVANVPRLDYLGSTCPRLLLEPQRTNLITFSEQLNNAAWGKTNITISANNATSPDGYQNADTCLADGVNAVHIIASNLISFTSGTAYSFSVFAKKGTNNFMQLIISSTVGGMFANFDLNNGTVGTLGTLTGTTPTSSIVDYGNGWYRCVINFTPTATTSAYANFVIVTSASAARAEANTLSTSVILWGAQLEQGAYSTSLIPTLAASATRSVDDATKTGITSLIGQTEGTLFLDLEGGANDSANHFLGLSDGTTGNRIVIVRSSSNTLYAQIRVGGVEEALIQTATLTANTRYKCAVAYKLNDIAFYVNGALVGTDSAATIPATSVFATNSGVSSSYFERAINQTLIFKTRLTNAELAELTTL